MYHVLSNYINSYKEITYHNTKNISIFVEKGGMLQ